MAEEFIVLDESDDQQIVNLPPRAFSYEERERKSHHWHNSLYVASRDPVYLSRNMPSMNVVFVSSSVYKKFIESYRLALTELLNIFSDVNYEELIKLSLEVAKRLNKRISPENIAKIIAYIYCRRHGRYYILPRKYRGLVFRLADLYNGNRDQRYELASQIIHSIFSEDPMLLRASLAILSWIRSKNLLGYANSKNLALTSMRIATILTNTYTRYTLAEIARKLGYNTIAHQIIVEYIKKLGISYRGNRSYTSIYSVDAPSDLCKLLERMDVGLADYVRCI